MCPDRTPDLELARIHGWLCGDGRVEERLEKGKQSPHLEVRFFPDDATVAKLFRRNFERRFGRTPLLYDTRKTEGCYTLRFRDVKTCRLILSFGPFGLRGWRVPDFRFPEETREWTKSFFDDEAYVNLSSECIQVKSVNGEGLRKVHQTLNDLGVEARSYGPYPQKKPEWSPYYMIVIPKNSLASYDKLIGFNHPVKKKALRNLIAHLAEND